MLNIDDELISPLKLKFQLTKAIGARHIRIRVAPPLALFDIYSISVFLFNAFPAIIRVSLFLLL